MSTSRPVSSGRRDSLGREIKVSAEGLAGRADAPAPPGGSAPAEFPSVAEQFAGIARAGGGDASKRDDWRRPLRAAMLVNVRQAMLDLADAPARAGHLASMRLRDWPDQARATMRVKLRGTETPPHPEYDYENGWTSPEVRSKVEALPWTGDARDTASKIEGIFEQHGYDSIDRELAFWHWSQRTGLPYDDFYEAWTPSGS